MARSPRIDFPGAWHHVMNRGARRAPIFNSDSQGLLFMECIADAHRNMGLEVHAYALMPNHYHLLVRTPLGNLSRSMRQVNGLYTKRVNRLRGWDGPVFRGRFHSQLVEDDVYLSYLLAYIHLNPVRAGLVQRLDQSSWTSHRAYLGRERGPDWLRTDLFLERFGGARPVGRFVQELRQGREEWPAALDLETGLLRHPAESPRFTPRSPSPSRVEAICETDVLRIVCAVTGATMEELRRADRGPRANPARRFAVWALFRSQRFTHADIAAALVMPRSQVAKVLSRLRKDSISAVISEWMGIWREGGYMSNGNT